MLSFRGLIVSVVFFFTVQNYSQSIFPLSVGNTWQYEINYIWVEPPQPQETFTFSIVGDTVMQDGIKYWVISPHDMFGEKFIRSDSTRVYYWDRYEGKEKLVFDVTAPLDSLIELNWNGYLYYQKYSAFPRNTFGHHTYIHPFELGGIIFADIELGENFGYVKYEYFSDTEDIDEWTLKGCIINDTLYGTITDVAEDNNYLTDFSLSQNYPNPFNPSTTIKFYIPQQSSVQLKVYDLLGKEIVTLVDETKAAGFYETEFIAENFSSGIYFYKMQAVATDDLEKYVEIKKMIFLK